MSERQRAEHSPTVTVVIPTYQEERSIGRCLGAIATQDHPAIVETLVVDGRSTDSTRQQAEVWPGVRVLDNPRRMQASALNIGLCHAAGEIVVRVDGHCVIAPDYISRCVRMLEGTGAAMVGGAMTPVDGHGGGGGIPAAMASSLGAGPARFHGGGSAGWVDTVYLGAFRARTAVEAGGYAEDVGVNEDAELAYRLSSRGGVWFDPSIRSGYSPRSGLPSVARQFFRYGLSRAATIKRHPHSLRARQLATPALMVGLALPSSRRWVAGAYATAVVGATLASAPSPPAAVVFALALPTMHLAWGAGFLAGMAGCSPPRPKST